MAKTLGDFLSENKTVTGETHTHTRIGDKELKIFGGSYNISNDKLDDFYKLYYEHVFTNRKREFLTEKQLDNGVIAIDLDLHYDNLIDTRQHDATFIQSIIEHYANELKNFYNFKTGDEFNIYVMQKTKVNTLDIKTKDGIHIIIGLNMERKKQIELRHRMINNNSIIDLFNRLPLINTLTGVFDETITRGTTNWQFYGSRKPSHDAYKLTQKLKVCYGEDNEFDYEEEIINMTPEILIELSVRNTDRPTIDQKDIVLKADTLLNRDTNANALQVMTDEALISASRVKPDATVYEKLLACIGDKRCASGKFPEWYKVGQALKNELKDEAIEIFVNWTNQYGSPNKKNEAIGQITKGIKYNNLKTKDRLSRASLHYWAKMDNPILYKTLFAKPDINSEITENEKLIYEMMEPLIETSTEVAFANFFNSLNPNMHKCVSLKAQVIYSYTNGLWKQNEGGVIIRNLITSQLGYHIEKYLNVTLNSLTSLKDDSECDPAYYETIRKRNNKLADLRVLCGKTSWKNNILREILDLNHDEDFEDRLNKKLDYLPLKCGNKFNMKTNEIEPRTMDDYFSYECNAKFVEYNPENEGFKFAEKYFNDLFCGNQDTKQCVLDILKSCLTGRTLRYIYFFTGRGGSNGKSVLLETIKRIFGGAVDTVSKLVAIKQKGNNTNTITTELEKLTRNRLGLMSEFSDTDELNETRIKEITGGDRIDYRALFKSNKTIVPTINLFCALNELPKFKVEMAMLRRIINVPFNNTFETSKDFEELLKSYDDYIFSYIMIKGRIKDKFETSEEMNAMKQEYADENVDPLKEFITSNLEACNNDKHNKPIKIEEFREQYKAWLKSQGYPEEKRQKTAFTRALTTHGVESKESNGTRKLFKVKWREEDDDCDDQNLSIPESER